MNHAGMTKDWVYAVALKSAIVLFANAIEGVRQDRRRPGPCRILEENAAPPRRLPVARWNKNRAESGGLTASPYVFHRRLLPAGVYRVRQMRQTFIERRNGLRLVAWYSFAVR